MPICGGNAETDLRVLVDGGFAEREDVSRLRDTEAEGDEVETG